jgi:hypothetical protein
MRKKIYLPLFEKTEANKKCFKILLIIILGTIFYFIPKDCLGETYPICLYRILFNSNCIGCGTTRAIWSIMHFNFYDAIKYNKLIVITFPLLTGCIIHWIVKKNKVAVK